MLVEEYVQNLYPELYLDASYSFYVDVATSQISASLFGVQTNYAIALKACHNYYLFVARTSKAGGAITKESEGRTSVSYWQNNTGGKSTLNMSIYGQMLKELMNTMGLGASVGDPEVEL